MIRVVVFLISVAFIAIGVSWFVDRPGDVAVTWLGYRIETSVTVAALALLVLVAAVILLWSIARGILRSPEQVSLFFRHRRAMKGYLAVSRGLIAIGAGDLQRARKAADEAGRLSPHDPLTLLLAAQSAQMAGDRAAAERAFREMTRREDTKLLGLRGLHIEAHRRNDAPAARPVAEQAAHSAPELAWAGEAVLDDRCAAADWAGALVALDHMKGALDKASYRRKRAVLLTARALDLAEIDRDTSRALVLEAVKLAPGLVPAAALAGRRLANPAICARHGASWSARGRSIRTPTSPTPTRICGSRTVRASGSPACRSSPTMCPVNWRARWRWRAPRSTRANSPPRAPRSRLTFRRRPGASPR